MTSVVTRRLSHEGTDRTPCEGGGQYWSDASTSHGMTRMIDHHQKLGEKQGGDSSSTPSERTNPADTLISDF